MGKKKRERERWTWYLYMYMRCIHMYVCICIYMYIHMYMYDKENTQELYLSFSLCVNWYKKSRTLFMCNVPKKLPSPGLANSSANRRRHHVSKWFSTFSNWKLRRLARVQAQVRSHLMACVETVLLSKLADLEWRVWIFHLEFPFITLTIPLYLLFSKITAKYY